MADTGKNSKTWLALLALLALLKFGTNTKLFELWK
jgi:hypothetical protein